VLGIPATTRDPRFATNSARVENRAQLLAVLEERFANRTAREWEDLLVAADVPAGRVGDLHSAFERAAALGLQPTVSLGDGHAPQVAHPIRYSAMKPRRPAPAPQHREHDQRVREWLSGPADSVAQLLRGRCSEQGSIDNPDSQKGSLA
jgi:formyl-CoA transferase